MAYSKFKRKDLVEKFGLKFERDMILPELIPVIEPSFRLSEDIKEAILLPLNNEKARSELLIVPVLKEVWRNSNRQISIHSGENLDVDKSLGLVGPCDFLFSADTRSEEISEPLIALVEAKYEDFYAGVTQGAAQLIGARMFNEAKGIHINDYWGCSSNGIEWIFFKLTGKDLITHSSPFQQTDLGEILGAWKIVIDSALRQVGKI